MRRSTSPRVSSRLGAMLSISSMKMMEGDCLPACSKISRSRFSDSPYWLPMISGPAMEKKFASDSFATALASSVLPVPGGPWRITPFGGSMPRRWKSSGCRSGSSTISRTWSTASPRPPISS